MIRKAIASLALVTSFAFAFAADGATCFVLTDAGSPEVNGSYMYLQDVNGFPAYYSDTIGTGYVILSGGGATQLIGYSEGYRLYWNATTDNVPLLINETQNTGQEPIPTITQGVETSGECVVSSPEVGGSLASQAADLVTGGLVDVGTGVFEVLSALVGMLIAYLVFKFGWRKVRESVR